MQQFAVFVFFAILSQILSREIENDLNILNEWGATREIERFATGIWSNYCGVGNVTDGPTVSGFMHDVDECCRMHDLCPDFLLKQEDFEQYPGLRPKKLIFTSLHCDCDREFYNCLVNTNSTAGSMILKLYSFIQRECFSLEHPVVKCLKKNRQGLMSRCGVYQLNGNEEKQWQWFDLPLIKTPLTSYSFPIIKYN